MEYALEYKPDILFAMMVLHVACLGGLALAWLTGYAYWRYAKRTNLFEISSLQLALMLVMAIVGWFSVPYLVAYFLGL
jgi:uncharacterized protein HemY